MKKCDCTSAERLMAAYEAFDLRKDVIEDLAEKVGVKYYYRLLYKNARYSADNPETGLCLLLKFAALDCYALAILTWHFKDMPKKWHEYEDEGRHLYDFAERIEMVFWKCRENKLLPK